MSVRISNQRHGGISAWWGHLSDASKFGVIFGGFLLFFLLLLLPIPLSGSLLGSVDSLFLPALSDTYLNRIRAAVTGEFVGRAMFPADIAHYGETGIGVASIFVFLRFVGINDVYAVYLTQVVLLAIMGTATVLFATEFTRSLPGALLAGFIFSTSNFIWADIDHLIIHFYFLALVCAYLLRRALRERNARTLLAAGVIGGLQVYFSAQVYVYQTMILAVMILFNFADLGKTYSTREKLIFAGAYLLIPLPLILFYFLTLFKLGVVDMWPRSQWEQIYSLHVADLLRELPGKFVRYPFISLSGGGWAKVAHSAFIGLATPALALVGLKGVTRPKMELVTIGVLGFVFALGSTIDVGGGQIPSPLALFYQHVPLANFLRVGLRSYSLSILAMSILAGIGWHRLSQYLAQLRPGLPALGLVVALLFIAGENISNPLNAFETVPYPAVPKGYVQFFEDKPDALILDLPSKSTTWPYYVDEIIYVLWQTKHERNILGGVNGYYPASRLEAQHYVDLLPSEGAFEYFLKLGVTHFVWHKSPYIVCHIHEVTYGCDPSTGLRSEELTRPSAWLRSSPHLALAFSNRLIEIYELH